MKNKIIIALLFCFISWASFTQQLVQNKKYVFESGSSKHLNMTKIISVIIDNEGTAHITRTKKTGNKRIQSYNATNITALKKTDSQNKELYCLSFPKGRFFKVSFDEDDKIVLISETEECLICPCSGGGGDCPVEYEVDAGSGCVCFYCGAGGCGSCPLTECGVSTEKTQLEEGVLFIMANEVKIE